MVRLLHDERQYLGRGRDVVGLLTGRDVDGRDGLLQLHFMFFVFLVYGIPWTYRDWLQITQMSSIRLNNSGNCWMAVFIWASYWAVQFSKQKFHVSESNNVIEFNRSVVNASFAISIPVRYNIGKRNF
jgi:hypothetical protein